MFAHFALGPAITISNSLTQFKIEQGFGYHFSGNSSGPAIGFALQESFGSQVFIFQPGARLWYDIPVQDNLGVYITPTAGVGMALITSPFFDTQVAFDLQFGAEVRFTLGDRGMLFMRPLGFDLAIASAGVAVRYDLMFGGGATF